MTDQTRTLCDPKHALPLTLSFLTIACALVQPSLAQAPGSGTWTSKAPLSVGRAEIGVAALDGKVYVLGGTEQIGDGKPIWNSTLNSMYDPRTNTWTNEAPLPTGLSHIGAATLDGKLYAIGGFTDIVHMGPQDLAFVYDPKANRWTALPDISSPRGSVAAAAVDGKLHIFGGRISDKIVKLPAAPGMPELSAGFGTVTTHQVYDPKSGKWTDGLPIPGPARDHMGIAVLDGKVHLFGGRVADVVDNLDRHDVYDPKTNKWTTAAPLPKPRSSGAYTVLDGLIVYAGGECKPGGQPFTPNAFDDVTAYDPKTDKWTALKNLPQARHAFGAATIGHSAYFVAGAPLCGGGTTVDTLMFTLP